MREVTTQPFYMYVQTKDGVEFPFAKVEDNSFVTSRQAIEKPVLVNGVKYYDEFFHGYEKGKEYIYIGDALKIPSANSIIR